MQPIILIMEHPEQIIDAKFRVLNDDQSKNEFSRFTKGSSRRSKAALRLFLVLSGLFLGSNAGAVGIAATVREPFNGFNISSSLALGQRDKTHQVLPSYAYGISSDPINFNAELGLFWSSARISIVYGNKPTTKTLDFSFQVIGR